MPPGIAWESNSRKMRLCTALVLFLILVFSLIFPNSTINEFEAGFGLGAERCQEEQEEEKYN